MTNVSEIDTLPEANRKAIQLFTYLRELCDLRTVPKRDVADYPHVLWFEEIPEEPLCRCIAWNRESESPDDELEAAPWFVEVRKPKLKPVPRLPEQLEPWIRLDQVQDSSTLEAPGEPELFSEIPVKRVDEQGEAYTEILLLDDHEEITEAWMKYVEDRWRPWAKEDQRLQAVLKTYNKLFTIYQQQEKLGELFEVVIGVGHIAWNSPVSGRISRHFMSLQARVDFEPELGIVRIVPGSEGTKPSLELDMLETDDRPEGSIYEALESSVNKVGESLWPQDLLETACNIAANTLGNADGGTGKFEPKLQKSRADGDLPVVSLAPALILRSRTHRTFVDFYDDMLEQLKNGGAVPTNVRSLVEIIDNPDRQPANDDGSQAVKDPEIYFPLPSNREQRLIVERVDGRPGVLVQGPPGTGKSHTIANLISHFLAQGKRVLVTSETPRALKVLRSMLPEEIRELCVTWLGAAKESQDSLEKSVQGITQQEIDWDKSANRRGIRHYENELYLIRRKRAETMRELCALRESDACNHNVFGYKGTLQSIAYTLNDQRERFGWFEDRPDEEALPTVTTGKLITLYDQVDRFDEQRKRELSKAIIPSEKLIPPEEFQDLCAAEETAQKALNELDEYRDYEGYDSLVEAGPELCAGLQEHLVEILACFERSAKHVYVFAAQAANEVAADQDRVWRELLEITEGHLEDHLAISRAVARFQISGLDGRNAANVTADANALKAHLESGKGLGLWLFRPKAVRKGLYLIKEVRVDGVPCDNVDTLRKLLDWLDLNRRLDELEALWANHVDPPSGSQSIKLAFYEGLCEPLRDALAIHDHVSQARKHLASLPVLRLPRWYERQQVEALVGALHAAARERDLAEALETFSPMLELAKAYGDRVNAHETCNEVWKAVQGRDGKRYAELYQHIAALHQAKECLKELQLIKTAFRNCAPRTYNSFYFTRRSDAWIERFKLFGEAWKWAQAHAWIEKATDPETPAKLAKDLEIYEKRERDTLKELAVLKAWQTCIDKLGPHEITALKGWSLAVRKIREYGKYVVSQRRRARELLKDCRPAVPCWIMPIYQVVQTVEAAPDAFDVVIVDEASQSGPDALLLGYLGKQLIVVGDDKQIAPQYPGIKKDSVQYLQQLHLKDVHYGQLVDLDSSLFDQAQMRLPASIRLREHFRCMPEIIQFSNRLCYSSDPLIPLRQYGTDRLEPVKTTFVRQGFRKGRSPNILNQTEAEALVEQVAACCADPAYTHSDGKPMSMGVIALLGHAQSQLISTLLVERIGAEEMDRRQILCGEAYAFQGDERDVIFLSMVDAPVEGRPIRKTASDEDQRRFNVAASRAKNQLWLFHSAGLRDMSSECLRYQLLEHCLNPSVEGIGPELEARASLKRRASDPDERRLGTQPPPFDSWFEVDVYLDITDRGYRVIPQHKVDERYERIDLVVQGLEGQLAVECYGDYWHGPEKFESDMERQRTLERCGWEFVIIRGYEYNRSPEKALEKLWKRLETRGIRPESDWEAQRVEVQRQRQGVAATKAQNEHFKPKDRNDSDSSAPDDTASDDGNERETKKQQSKRRRPPKANNEDQEMDLFGPVNRSESSDVNPSVAERLGRVLEHARNKKLRPDDVTASQIQLAVLKVLEDSKNNSQAIKNMTTPVLSLFSIRTSGKPWKKFEGRVKRAITELDKRGKVEKYKMSKNRRVRLVTPKGR